MPNNNETTLVSLFHTQEHASKAMNDLRAAGVPAQSIQTLGSETGRSAAPEQALTTLKSLSLPAKDLQVLSDGLKSGGTLIVVRATQAFADKVERVFEYQNAEKIDERAATSQPRATAAAASGDTLIPVVEEELVVGKQRVDRGGVRVFTHMVETPVEEQVVLREEHATLERHAVNRPISEAEMNALQQGQSIEVREMGEEAVVGKTARVVEEVHVGKQSTERTQQIKDTVRKTQVEVDQIAGDDPKRDKRKS
jgi:uncharacterized protein (TIGR02271 family)